MVVESELAHQLRCSCSASHSWRGSCWTTCSSTQRCGSTLLLPSRHASTHTWPLSSCPIHRSTLLCGVCPLCSRLSTHSSTITG